MTLVWFGHVQCIEDSRKAKQIYYWKRDKRGSRGRLCITLKGTVWRDIELMDTNNDMRRRRSEGSGQRIMAEMKFASHCMEVLRSKVYG